MGKKKMMNIRDIESALEPEELTQEVKDWFDKVDSLKNEDIEEGLILEFSDLLNHPTDPEIWERFISSLSYLTKFEKYHTRIIANINLIQQLELHVTDKIDAPMAVSLISPTDLVMKKSKINIKARPKLLINPSLLFLMLLKGGHTPAKPNNMYKHILGILIHETYHITRGDLLYETRHHYASKQKAEEYITALYAKPIVFLDKKRDPVFTTQNLHQFNNIMSDLSINEDIRSIDPHLMPYLEDARCVMAATTEGYLLDVLSGTGVQPDASYKTPDAFGITSLKDFYSENIPLRDKQYAIFEYHRATISDDDMESAKKEMDQMLEALSNAKSGNTPGTQSSSAGMGAPGLAAKDAPNSDEITQQNGDATNNMDEDEINDATGGLDNIINVANSEASEETNGKACSLEPSQGLRQKILNLKKAKPLPPFKVSFDGMIKDLNRKMKLNFHLRHIAQPKRMDMARRQKMIQEGGMHVYMDVSGSVTDKVIEDVFNVMMATVKTEPVMLYLFASSMSVTPFEITRKTKLKDVQDFIQNEDVGYGTYFTPLFENMKLYNKQKHAIFSDFYFDMNEFAEFTEDFKKTPIIYIAEYMDHFKTTPLYNYALNNPRYNYVLPLEQYSLSK